VSAGSGQSLAVKTNGTLWAWGEGSLGKLGLGNVLNRSSPVQVGALSNWSQVSAKNSFTIATKTDGTLWAWGNNFYGWVGDGTTVNKSSPVQIGSLTSWQSANYGSTSDVSGALAR
jgi:alpha-tubulin suppressor-like RCC1 family protein